MANNDHISTTEVEQDIEDTEREISQMEREVEGLRLIGDRLSNYKADARVDGIRRRKEFIANLKKILEERARLSGPTPFPESTARKCGCPHGCKRECDDQARCPFCWNGGKGCPVLFHGGADPERGEK